MLKTFHKRVFIDNRHTEKQTTSTIETVDSCHSDTAHIIYYFLCKQRSIAFRVYFVKMNTLHCLISVCVGCPTKEGVTIVYLYKRLIFLWYKHLEHVLWICQYNKTSFNREHSMINGIQIWVENFLNSHVVKKKDETITISAAQCFGKNLQLNLLEGNFFKEIL